MISKTLPIILISILFLLVSCGGGKIKPVLGDGALTVDPFVEQKDMEAPSIREPEPGGRYGPKPLVQNQDDDGEDKKVMEREPVIGLFIDAGGYKTFAYLQLHEQLRRNGIRPAVYSGVSTGALVAVNLASGKVTSEVEWDFYKFTRNFGNEKILSNSWVEGAISVFFPEEKEKSKIEMMEKTLILPLFEAGDQPLVLVQKGTIKDGVFRSLFLDSDSEGPRNALHSSGVSPSFLFRYGVDLVIWVHPHEGEFKLERGSGYDFGIFSRYISNKSPDQNDDRIINIRFTPSNVALDSADGIASFIQNVNKDIKKNVDTIKERVEEWKTNINNRN